MKSLFEGIAFYLFLLPQNVLSPLTFQAGILLKLKVKVSIVNPKLIAIICSKLVDP